MNIEPSTSMVAMAITWGVWATVSIFNQKQELAIQKQQLLVFKEELNLLKKIQTFLEQKTI